MAEPRGTGSSGRDDTSTGSSEATCRPADGGLDWARSQRSASTPSGGSTPHVPLARMDHAAVRRLRHTGGDERALRTLWPARTRSTSPSTCRRSSLDSDDPRAEGEVGRMAIDSPRRWRRRSTVSPPTACPSFTINSMAFIQAMFFVVAEKQGVAWDRVVTTPQNDILKEFVARDVGVPVEPRSAWSATSPSSARHTQRSTHLGVRLPHPRGRVHSRSGDGLRLPHRVADLL